MAAQAAHEADRVCTTLAHLLDAAFLREAYRHTNTSSAAGLDGVTAKPYAAPLDEHRRDLPGRLRRGGSQAPPGERVWLEKEEGGPRPLGNPTFEANMVQRAVARRLEARDEQDLQDSSSGLRRGRSPQEARHA
jgi:retron-type reverse transcriptase